MSPNDQTSFFPPESPQPIPNLDFRAADSLSVPPVWVSRLEMWESLDAGEPIRVVDLRRGLNIVWAPDAVPEGKEDEGPPENITGHCAGKTLFTRLLRYCLGESTFAAKEVKAAIRDELHDGYVLAQVHLDGEKWAVARPLGTARSSYAAVGVDLAALRNNLPSRTTYEEFRKVLEERIDRMPVGLIPGKKKTDISWLMLLAWAARDQYCHFESIYTWRSTRSGSDPLNFEKPKEDPVFLIRLILSLITGDEVGKEEKLAAALIELERLNGEIEDRQREPEYWRQHYHTELHSLLNIPLDEQVEIRVDDLFTPTYDKRIREKEKAAETTAAEKEVELVPLRRDLETLREHLYEANEAIRFHNNLLATVNKQYNAATEQLEELDKALQPFEDWRKKKCLQGDIPFKHCEHVLKRVAELTEHEDRNRPPTEEEVRQREEALREQQEVMKELRSRRDDIQENLTKVEGKIKEIEREIEGVLRTPAEMRKALASFEKWDGVVSGASPDAELAAMYDKVKTQETVIEGLRSGILELRAQHDVNLARLSSIYDVLCKNVIGSGAVGEITFAESKGLVAELKLRASFDSPGIDPLKVILFDLAALVYRMEGHGQGIGLLIHDSPRESDLGWSLYSSFLRVARKIEEAFGGEGTCPFQYIVTTTTKPPTDLQVEPYCILKLNASLEDGKLLKRDFGG